MTTAKGHLTMFDKILWFLWAWTFRAGHFWRKYFTTTRTGIGREMVDPNTLVLVRAKGGLVWVPLLCNPQQVSTRGIRALCANQVLAKTRNQSVKTSPPKALRGDDRASYQKWEARKELYQDPARDAVEWEGTPVYSEFSRVSYTGVAKFLAALLQCKKAGAELCFAQFPMDRQWGFADLTLGRVHLVSLSTLTLTHENWEPMPGVLAAVFGSWKAAMWHLGTEEGCRILFGGDMSQYRKEMPPPMEASLSTLADAKAQLKTVVSQRRPRKTQG